MTTFVLVHGGWHGAWAWQRVIAHLRAAGHDAYAPTLTGLADRSHLLTPDVNLSTHIEDVIGLIHWEQLNDIILCGHSYGGIVVTAVADRIPQRLKALVYADAFVPSNGTSLLDLVEDDRRDLLLAGAKNHGDGWKVPSPKASAWNVQDEADQQLIDRLTTPHPLAAMREKVTLSGAWKSVPVKSYVVADSYQRPTFKIVAERLKSDNEPWTIDHLDCGHEPMIERPHRLTEILLRATGTTSKLT